MGLTRAAAWVAIGLAVACARGPSEVVVVYAAVDQVHAEPILADFERASGIRVLPVYDVEAAKTTGLVTRLLAERGRPRADVFWSGELAQTLRLEEAGVLAPWPGEAGAELAGRCWRGVGGRARVILVNTDLVGAGEEPASVDELLDPRWPPSRVATANPLFGTAFTEAVARYAVTGPAPARAFYRGLAERGVRIVDGNATVRDLVAAGQLAWGVTDSDDAAAALARGARVRVVVPDQDGRGTLVVPGTVAVVAGGPHPDAGWQLARALAAAATEEALVAAGFCQVRSAGGDGAGILAGRRVQALAVTPAELAAVEATARAELRELLAR